MPTPYGNPIGSRSPITSGRTASEKIRAAAVYSILKRAGINAPDPPPNANDFIGWKPVELARECLRLDGQPYTGGVLDVTGRALTSSDFPNILAGAANKALFEGYEASSETWPIWCGTGSVSDFKAATSARVSEPVDLDEVPEGGSYKYGDLGDSKETFSIATYGKLLVISRQAIINDDLGAFTVVPQAHGEAASRKVGDMAYTALTANANMGDGNPLFDLANHANIGTAAVLSETSIAEAIKFMQLQKDIGGKRRLNIRPEFYLAPVALEGGGEVFFNSGQFAGSNAAATRSNPYAGSRFTRVYEPRLDDNSATAWYLAGPKGKTVTVFFLNGKQTPYVEQRDGWNVDGLQLKVRIDAAAKAVGWRGLVKNAGV